MYEEIDGPQVRREKNFYYCTSQIVMDGISSWLTEIKIRWPLILCVNATGTSPYNSQFEAALLAAMQLKVSFIIKAMGMTGKKMSFVILKIHL